MGRQVHCCLSLLWKEWLEVLSQKFVPAGLKNTLNKLVIYEFVLNAKELIFTDICCGQYPSNLFP